MKARPTGKTMFVETTKSELEKNKKTDSGILLTDNGLQELKKRTDRGTVVAIGDECIFSDGSKLNVGDTILFSRSSGVETEIEGKDYLVMQQSCILAVL